ncbi:MAG: hypothetical protein ACI81O_001924 [Cyclobacteriaceae bacterium]|jgi:hypothetical protein
MVFGYAGMKDWHQRTYQIAVISVLLLALLGVPSALFAAAASAVSADQGRVLDGVISLYPRAQLVDFSQEETSTTHRIMLGALEKINNDITPEASRYVQGLRSRHTYLIADESRTGLVFDFFSTQLQQKGQILYQCIGRECGSSSHWANGVFGRRILYGPKQFQHYIVGIINGYYTAIYVAQRATGEVYAHLDVIEDLQASLLDGDNLLRALQSLVGVQLNIEPDENMTEKLVQILMAYESINIYIVAHDGLRASETVPDAIKRTTQVGVAFKSRLVAAGISAQRLQAYGVGPLAPLEGAGPHRLELIKIADVRR